MNVTNQKYHILKSFMRCTGVSTWRDERGAIEFETVETKFIFNADRKIDIRR
ncbi:hypothetical protein O9929_01295 [Vibrio lentus]|nr:hypothetical protein [Vibrio lentus]